MLVLSRAPAASLLYFSPDILRTDDGAPFGPLRAGHHTHTQPATTDRVQQNTKERKKKKKKKKKGPPAKSKEADVSRATAGLGRQQPAAQ
jgi:sRNA-binding protein